MMEMDNWGKSMQLGMKSWQILQANQPKPNQK